MEHTMEEYEEWRKSFGEEGDIDQHVQDAYSKARETLEELTAFEADLVRSRK